MSAQSPPAAFASPEKPAAAAANLPRPFSALRYTAWLVGPLAVVCLFTKIHKLLMTPGGDLGSALAALFWDVIFLAAFGLATWGLLEVSRGIWRGLARVALHLVTFVATLVLFVEHGFFLTTGTLLDAYTFGYGLAHLGPLGKVYLSEMGLGVWLGLALLLAVHALPLRALRRSAAPHPAPTRTMTLLVAMAVLPACTCVAALAVDVAPAVAPLADNAVLGLASDALDATEEAAPAEAEAPSHFEPPALATGPRAVPEGQPANVIVIVMESLRARSTSLHDPSLDTTPFMASLAARGAMAETTWTAVTHTSKAIVGVLCGIYPKLDLPIEEAEPTGLPPTCLARILRERGYATAFMQTATAHFERRDQLVQNMGYETFLAKETIPKRDFEETSYFGWEDEALIAPALDWTTRQVEARQPFFLTLLTLSTHHTYGTPTRFTRTKRASGELDDYLNAVRYLDETLDKLFSRLEEAGALEHTLVVLVGDHGEGFGEHGRRQHDAVIYEEGLHVPLLLVGPGVPAGTRLGGLRHAVDIVPTALEWLGTPVRDHLPGRSLLSSDGHPHLFGSCWLRQRCMATRDATHKLIWHFDKQPPELFDLAADPLEEHDLLADTPEATWQPMRERLLAWRADNLARWAGFFSEAAQDFVTTLPPLPERALDVVFAAPPSEEGAEPRPLARLIGADLAATRVKSGDPIRVTLHWEVLGPPGTWAPFTHLLGRSDGARPRYNADHVPVGGRHPTSAWQPGTFVTDAFRIQPQKPLAPGTYELVVGFWDASQNKRGTDGRAEVEGIGESAALIDADRRVRVLTVEILP